MSERKSRSTSDLVIVRYLYRVKDRNQRHGNWRQVYLDCEGSCQYPIEEGAPCGELETLEFHAQFGEAKDEELKLQQRVLLCNYHHWSIHGEKWVNKRHGPSMLQADVNAEILLCGSLANWIEYYNLIERSIEHDFEEDISRLASDLNLSEDS